MPIAKLSVDLEARLANLQAGLDKAGLLAEQSADRMNGAFKTLQTTIKGAFAGLGLRELIQFFNATVDGVDKLNDLADATGASIENLSALEDIAVRTGTSVDTMGDAIVKMNKSLADAKPGSDQAAVIDALGLSVQELKALDPVEAFQKLAIAMQGFANDGNKARAAQELFGRSLREVAPLLKDVAEAGALVGTVTKQQAEEAERFNKELFALEKSATDAGRALIGPLLSALNETIAKFREGAKEGKSFYRTLFEEQLRLLGLGGALPSGGGATGSWQDEAPKPSLPAILGTPKPAKPPAGARRATADRGLAEIFDPAERFRNSERAAQAAVDEALRTSQLTEVERERAASLKLVAQEQERLNDLLADAPSAQLEQTRRDMELLAAAFESGRINAEQFAEAANARLGNIAEAAKTAADEWSIFADQGARNIQDALGNTLEATLAGNFDSIGDMWKNLLIRMASEAAAAQIAKELFGDFGGKGGGSLGGSIGSLLALLPKFDAGTPFVPRDMIAMVHRGERIVPAAENARSGRGGGASITYAPVIQIDSRTDQAQVAQLVSAGVQQGQRQLLAHLKASGVTA